MPPIGGKEGIRFYCNTRLWREFNEVSGETTFAAKLADFIEKWTFKPGESIRPVETRRTNREMLERHRRELEEACRFSLPEDYRYKTIPNYHEILSPEMLGLRYSFNKLKIPIKELPKLLTDPLMEKEWAEKLEKTGVEYVEGYFKPTPTIRQTPHREHIPAVLVKVQIPWQLHSKLQAFGRVIFAWNENEMSENDLTTIAGKIIYDIFLEKKS